MLKRRISARMAALSLAVLVITTAINWYPSPAAGGQTERPTLNVLGTAEEAYVLGMTQAFEDETGIRTSYVRLSAGQALDRLMAERDGPGFSVWWGGAADQYIAAAAAGLLEPYKPLSFDKIPPRFKDPDGAWTGVYVGVLGFGVNTRVLGNRGLSVPTSWADLTNDAYRGLISVAHPATSGTAFTMLATVVQLHDRDHDAGFGYLDKLAANVRRFEEAGAVPSRVSGQGDVAIAIAFSHDIVAAQELGFTDLRLIFPSEGTGYEIGAMALVKGGPSPVEARRFMDWAIGEHAQEIGPELGAFQIPTNPDARVSPRSAVLSSIRTIDYDFLWAGANRESLIARFIAQIAAPL
ncbi:MAG: extracellular solute-binding protein family 1 protein [Chloroflexi bacterium]|nr:extracellular solute-binding protein family 1 protein [Chloroflexota bacterium]